MIPPVFIWHTDVNVYIHNPFCKMTISVLQLCAVDFTVRNFLRPLIYHLEQQGYDVTAACSKGEYFPELKADGIHIVDIPISRSMNVLKHAKSSWILYRRLKKNRFDIIHVHTPIAGLIGRFAAKLAGVPIKIYTAHGFYFHDDMPEMKRRFHIGLEKIGAKCGDYIFTQSDEDRHTAIKTGIARPDGICAIGNGVDLDRFNLSAVSEEHARNLYTEFHIPEKAPLVGMIGRMVREKGYMEFFEAAAMILREFPDAHFLCIGDQLKSDHDGSRKDFMNQIKKLDIRDRTHFTGLRKDIPELLSILDVYTLPSYREGMPRSIIEAMGMKLPVVTTNIRGCREEVVDGETGYIVPPKDAESLGKAIAALLRNPEKRKQFGRAGRARAEKLYSEKIVLEKQTEIYAKLIQEKRLEHKL